MTCLLHHFTLQEMTCKASDERSCTINSLFTFFPVNILDEVKLNVILTLSGQEDCLYLNLYAPVQAAKDPLPVMVWIYGGGFTMGSAIPLQYGPQKFMDTNSVILVSDP